MVKGLLRFGLIWALSIFLTPYVDRFLRRLAERAPSGSFIEDLLRELSTQYSTSLINAFGQTVGDMLFGEKG
jgi:hypothetical protein